MRKMLLLITTMTLVLVSTACGKKEPSFYDQVVAETAKYESTSIIEKSKSSSYLFDFLGYEDFEIKRELNKSDRASAKIINHSRYTFEGHIALVVYDENMSILDTQYVSLPKVGLKPDESFIVDEIIREDSYYTMKFADADMLRQK